MPQRSQCIFLNDNIVFHAAQRGVARYFRHIVNAVVARFGSHVVIFSPETGDYGAAKHIRSPRFRGSRRLRAHDILASITAYRERASVFYSPYYGAARTTAAEVFTVYDMIHEMFPQHFNQENAWVRRFTIEKKHCLERASVLIAISENTAKDIVACYPHIDRAKIAIIPLGVDDFFFQTSDQQYGTSEKPFFLYVGHRTSHKNFLRLLTAFGQSELAGDFDLRVISPTGNGFDSHEIETIRRYGLQERVQLFTATSEAALHDSYAQAVAFVCPSEYEGFGLTILEAMASGTLVAASYISSMPEVGSTVAFYFDPYSVESIADCLQRVAGLSAQERRERIARGLAWARMFTWTRCQQQTVDLFQGLM